MVSNVGDLVKFGNILLYSYHAQNKDNNIGSIGKEKTFSNYKEHIGNKDGQILPGYLKPSTVELLWTPVPLTRCSWHPDGGYGLGYHVVPITHSNRKLLCAGHSGASVGQSSVLTILTDQKEQNIDKNKLLKASDPVDTHLPKGIVVAILGNMQKMALSPVGLEIALLFLDTNLA